jgi:hypothetical protein
MVPPVHQLLYRMREERRTNNGSDVTDDSSLGGVEARESLGSLKVDGVEILTSMGEEIEPYHQLPQIL